MRRKLSLFLLALACLALLGPGISGLATPAWAEDGSSSALTVTPTSLAFTYQRGGALPASQKLSVSYRYSTSFSVSKSASWLAVAPTSGTTPGSITVSVNPGALAAGTYNGSVTISSRHGNLTVPVSLKITSSTTSALVVTPTSLAFAFQQGGTTPSAQSLAVTSTGNALSFTDSKSSGASWLSLGRSSGTTPSSITVSATPGTMAPGTYTASIVVSSSAGSKTVPVTLTVTSATASGLVVSPASLAFAFQQGGTTPSAQSLSVTSTGNALSFTDSKSSGASWLSLSRSSGTTPSSITVSATPGTLAVGTYTASIVVSSSAGSKTVPVTLSVTSSTSGGGTGSGTYALLAWGELGMHCMDGKDYSVASVLPPYNTIYAKLLTKGSQPAPVTSGVTITYQAIADAAGSINTTSAGTSAVASKTNFWDWVYVLFRGQPAPDVGLHNFPVQSRTPQALAYDSTKGLWKAEGIPTSPYDDTGASNAYPMVQLVAKNTAGQVLATTTVVLAVSDEMSCKNCHAPNTNSAAMPSGGWISSYTLAQNIKLNILKKHDDAHPIPAAVLAAAQAKGYNYQSSLFETAKNLNNPVLCAACHASNALNAAGMDTGVKDASGNQMVPALTVSMHQQHAGVTLPGSSTTLDKATDPAGSCYQCHPGVNTKCQRGAMRTVACFSCHGNLSRVAQPTRVGWMTEPSCQMCHQNGASYTTTFTTADNGPAGTWRASSDTRFATNSDVPSAGFNLYRFSKGHGSVECSACHGSQHAEFPTDQPNDAVYSQNLQGYPGKLTECTACHTTAPMTVNGGPHGMHTVGATWVSGHHNNLSGGTAQCTYCHGADYRGTVLSKLLVAKTLNGKTFPAGHQMNCYDCHNGPSGG